MSSMHEWNPAASAWAKQCCLTIDVQLIKDRGLDDTSLTRLHSGQALLWGGIIQLCTLRCKLLLLQRAPLCLVQVISNPRITLHQQSMLHSSQDVAAWQAKGAGTNECCVERLLEPSTPLLCTSSAVRPGNHF